MAVTTGYLTKVKAACGVTATYYDSEVEAQIEAARLEMTRVGVDSTVAVNESNQLVYMAVRTYCRIQFAETEQEAERLTRAFTSQLADLSMSTGYMYEEAET